MGWLYTYNQNRKSLIEHLTTGFENDTTKVETLRHCYRGAAWAGVLYSLAQITRKSTGKTIRICRVDLLRWDKSCNGWGYKDQDESCGPYKWGCPKSYVRACTDPESEYSRDWRTKILGPAEVEERWPKSFGQSHGGEAATASTPTPVTTL